MRLLTRRWPGWWSSSFHQDLLRCPEKLMERTVMTFCFKKKDSSKEGPFLLNYGGVLTLSKSLLTVLRKWSEGFMSDGQGNPLRAKNCEN
jgi:hypothetical protein